jgi:uncharacterized integral membrane protein
MRGFFSFIAEVVSIVIIAAIAIFAVENVFAVHVSFLSRGFTADLWWLVVGAAVLGFILALLLLAPGRVAAGWRGIVLQREGVRRERELGQLREQHAQLQAEHERLQADHAQLEAEHDQLQAQRTPAAWPPALTTPAAAAAPTTPPTSIAPVREAPATAAPTPAQPTQTTVPAGQTGQPEQEQQRLPTLGERLRAATFGQPQQPETPEQDQTWTQGPTAPTA